MASPAVYRTADRPSPRAQAKPRVAAALFAAVLAACGGGGGGGDGGGGGGGGTAHAIGGRVDGLTGSGLVLQNNGGNNLSIDAAGAFRFTQTVAHGGAYAVTVFTQPQGQACSVAHGSGTATDDVSSVVVTCASTPPPPPPQTHTVGGSISGLTSAGLVLRNNGGDGITLAAGATSFTFPTPVARGSAYAVTIGAQPQGNDCTLANASGTIAQANVSNVQVNCGAVGPLTLVSSNPAANATNVPRNVVPSFTFSAPLDAATAAAEGSLMLATGTEYLSSSIGVAVQGAELRLQPTRRLLPAQLYNFSAGTRLRGARGESLRSTVDAFFTTADAVWGSELSFGTGHLGFDGQRAAASSRFGDAVVAWAENATGGGARVMARHFNAASGQWGEAVEIKTTSQVASLSLAMADSGDTVLALRATDLINVAQTQLYHRRAAGGQWIPGGISTDSGTILPRLTVHPGGAAHMVQVTDRSIGVTRGSADRATPWQLVGELAGLDARNPGRTLTINQPSVRIAALPDGGAMVVWEESGPTANPMVMARRVSAQGEVVGTAPVLISTVPTGAAAAGVSLAVQHHEEIGGSHAFVVWRGVGVDDERIHLRRWNSVSDAWEGTADDPLTLAVGFAADGWRMGAPVVAAAWGAGWANERHAHVLWGETGPLGEFRLRAVAVRPGATPTAPVTVVAESGSVQRASSRPEAPGAVVDRAGNLLVVYQHPLRLDNNGVQHSELRSQRRVQRSGTWAGTALGGSPVASGKTPQLAGASDTGSALAVGLGGTADAPVMSVRRFD